MMFMNITDTQKQEFTDIISKERLNSYNLLPEDDFTVLLKRYIYNIKVSETFYPILSILEIALRNKIHNTIDNLIKPNWLLSKLKSQDLLSYNEHETLLSATGKLKFKNKNLTKGALIAELSFGFWVNLCKKSYKNRIWDKQNFFSSIFPNFDNHFYTNDWNKTKTIFPELKMILQLRNRIFHHEIIINNKIGLQNCYDIIEKVLFSISEEYSNLLINTCRFNDLIKQKP